MRVTTGRASSLDARTPAPAHGDAGAPRVHWAADLAPGGPVSSGDEVS